MYLATTKKQYMRKRLCSDHKLRRDKAQIIRRPNHNDAKSHDIPLLQQRGDHEEIYKWSATRQ